MGERSVDRIIKNIITNTKEIIGANGRNCNNEPSIMEEFQIIEIALQPNSKKKIYTIQRPKLSF
jgi:hypothetical protein